MLRSKHVREAWVIFIGIAITLAFCVAIALAGDYAQSKVNDVRGYQCARSHYQKFEDRSGLLWCNGRVVVRVNVPH